MKDFSGTGLHIPLSLVSRLLRQQRPDPLLTVGTHTYVQRPRIIRYPGDVEPVYIGDYCSISGSVEILPGGNHNPHWISTFPFQIRLGLSGALRDGMPSSRGPVRIGNDVWVGRDAMILSGVTVGDGAVIGARAVVAKDVRPYAVVVGNPAVEIRRRFDDATVERFLEIKWWEWPERLVLDAARFLNSEDLPSFFDIAANYGGSDEIGGSRPR